MYHLIPKPLHFMSESWVAKLLCLLHLSCQLGCLVRQLSLEWSRMHRSSDAKANSKHCRHGCALPGIDRGRYSSLQETPESARLAWQLNFCILRPHQE